MKLTYYLFLFFFYLLRGRCGGGAAPSATNKFGRAEGTRPNLFSPKPPKNPFWDTCLLFTWALSAILSCMTGKYILFATFFSPDFFSCDHQGKSYGHSKIALAAIFFKSILETCLFSSLGIFSNTKLHDWKILFIGWFLKIRLLPVRSSGEKLWPFKICTSSKHRKIPFWTHIFFLPWALLAILSCITGKYYLLADFVNPNFFPCNHQGKSYCHSKFALVVLKMGP